MSFRTRIPEPSPLRAALDGATFTSAHHRIVGAPIDDVWAALHELRWGDLRIARLLMAIRAFGRTEGTMLDLGHRLTDPPSPAAPILEDPPHYSTSAMIGKPWLPTGPHREPADLAEVAAYADPG